MTAEDAFAPEPRPTAFSPAQQFPPNQQGRSHFSPTTLTTVAPHPLRKPGTGTRRNRDAEHPGTAETHTRPREEGQQHEAPRDERLRAAHATLPTEGHNEPDKIERQHTIKS